MKSSIRDKILKLNLSGLFFCSLLVGWIGYFFANDRINKDAETHLSITCDKEAARINASLSSIEQYVKTICYVVIEGIVNDSTLRIDSTRQAYTKQNLNFIRATINNVPDAVAAYLRYNPKFTPPTSGIFMSKVSRDSEIKNLTPTDFSKYSPDDVEHVGWYYIPIKNGKPTWMQPYENKNVDIYMISYVIPLFKHGEEIGVVGVDIDFNYLIKEIKKVKVFSTGFAYLEDDQGKIAYHPSEKMGNTLAEDSNHKYFKKSLSNGMTLVITAPSSEFNEGKNDLTLTIALFALMIIVLFAVISIIFSRSITKPLTKLTQAAKQMTNGNLDVSFDTTCNDEIGELGKSFSSARDYIKEYLGYVQGIAYKDSLTGLRNKTALDSFIHDFTEKMDSNEIKHFGIVALDVNNLKNINDTYGHDHGNKLLINASRLICQTFAHSPVFRIGGDEFLVILQHIDYTNRENLMTLLQVNMAKSEISSNSPWEQISIAAGLAIYNADARESFEAVQKRADEAMYKNKKEMKIERSI